ncbi:MAG: pentapeptide repeat-containing protein [Halobacteriaceae archaeon]
MTDSSSMDAHTIFELSPSEREEEGISPIDVEQALQDIIAKGSQTDKIIENCAFQEVNLDYETLDGANKHPLIFRECQFESFSAAFADIRLPLHFENCTIGELSIDGAYFESDIILQSTTVQGSVSAIETRFELDVDFTNTTFSDEVAMNEASFGDDTSFVQVTFKDRAEFRGAAFHGMSNELDDNADFTECTFEEIGDFQQATFEFVTFEETTFRSSANFSEVHFDGDVTFTGTEFRNDVDFVEVIFGEDADFSNTTFEESAQFQGAIFEGGARTVEDDASFEGAEFNSSANFRSAQFRYVTFEQATIEGHAMFEESQFDADADFIRISFQDEVDFDEARFDGDADFSQAVFEGPAVFRGAAFRGEALHLEMNAIFEQTKFHATADFDNATFTSANFKHAYFGDVIDFSGAAFEEIEFLAEPISGHAYVNFTNAVLKEGTIIQPEGEWIRYDLTQASVGDISLESEKTGGQRELLDYFRFCDTEFNEFDGYEFDFSEHTYYFDRNNWNLHTFDDLNPDRDYALPMSPENIETTYLKAKNAASSGGFVKAAGEFRVQRQRNARNKYLTIARNANVSTVSRISSATRVIENYFLDISCGYGMRLGRILTVFLLAPLFPAFLYAFGGPLFRTEAGQLSSFSQLLTPEGQAIFYKNLHFSYITFLTIGYGGIGPKGALARMLAGLEVYLSVVLGGLVLYALIKRSEL